MVKQSFVNRIRHQSDTALIARHSATLAYWNDPARKDGDIEHTVNAITKELGARGYRRYGANQHNPGTWAKRGKGRSNVYF